MAAWGQGDRQKNADAGKKMRPRFCNFAARPHVWGRAACFEATLSNFHALTFLLRPGFRVGPQTCPAEFGGGLGRTFAHAIADVGPGRAKLRVRPWWAGKSALNFGVITTPNGGRPLCGAPLSSSPLSRSRPLQAACRPKVTAPSRAPLLAPSSRTQPTTARSPGRRWAPLPVAQPATPVSARPATDTITAPAHRAARPVLHAIGAARPGGIFVFVLKTDITKGGAGNPRAKGRD